MPEPGGAKPPSGRAGFLTTVESVRGIAALYVAVAHTMIYLLFIHYNAPLFDLTSTREVVIRIVEGLIHGPMAVMVFFVISGLVIGRSLDGRDTRLPAAQSYVVFLARRFLRLYPAHIAALTGIIIIGWLCLHDRPPVDFSAYQPPDDVYFTDWLQAQFNPLHLKTVIANYAMIRWSMNLVVWSLFVEICAAPLLPLFHKLSRRDSPMLDAAVTGLLLALCAVAWGHLAVEYWFAFYLGMTVETRGRAWVAFVIRRCRPGLVLALSYALMAAPAIVLTDRTPVTSILEVAGAFSLVSLVVWCDKAALFGVLDHPLLRWNGRLSYSFYLWHYVILTMAVRGLFLAFSPEALHRQEVLVCALTAGTTIAAALATAQLSYSVVEVPFIGLGRRLAEAWRLRRGARPGRLIGLGQEQAAP
ncbi:MAG: acyltransferase [Alphaproteobacteria bacterium]|nr:acyltransferase [Alphaproteobacteria bacterium]